MQESIVFEKKEAKDMRNPYRVIYEGHTSRLMLKPYQKLDAERYSMLANNVDVQALDFGVSLPFEVINAKRKIEHYIDLWSKGSCYAFAVWHKEEKCLIGGTLLMVYPDHGLGELGYWMGQSYWGKGFATEAASAVIHFAFTELNLQKVFAQHIAENDASGHVLSKVGMSKEGVLRRHWVKEGRRVDLVQYGIINAQA